MGASHQGLTEETLHLSYAWSHIYGYTPIPCYTVVVRLIYLTGGVKYGSKSRSRLQTRWTLRRIGRGDSDQSQVVHAKRYIESLKKMKKT